MYSTIIKNVSNTNKKNESVRDYIIKYLAQREPKIIKIPLDRTRQVLPKKDPKRFFFLLVSP